MATMFQKRNRGKLPRKRKKACIKVEGRQYYWNTIKLADVTDEYPVKFWVQSKVIQVPEEHYAVPIPTPIEFW